MLLGLVRQSMLHCFCHTCRAPALPDFHLQDGLLMQKTRTNQPKRVQFVTTEVRCQEKRRGGVRYEVILSEETAKAAPPIKKLKQDDENVPATSAEQIERKLKAAEERRLKTVSCKMAAAAALRQKIEEATRKKDEHQNQFVAQTRQALDAKMDHVAEMREARIADLKTKLKDHIENVEKHRAGVEKQSDEVRNAIEEKMKIATQQRHDNLKKKLDRLKERNARAIEKQKSVDATIETRKARTVHLIENKLDAAFSIKEKEMRKKVELAKKHNEHLNEVKQLLENKKTEQVQKLESKLTAAELKREEEIKRKLEQIKRHDEHAELVRQNKASRSQQPIEASI